MIYFETYAVVAFALTAALWLYFLNMFVSWFVRSIIKD